jgi:hypothetical protein
MLTIAQMAPPHGRGFLPIELNGGYRLPLKRQPRKGTWVSPREPGEPLGDAYEIELTVGLVRHQLHQYTNLRDGMPDARKTACM